MTKDEIDALVMSVYRRRLDDDCSGAADRELKRLGPVKMQRHADIWRPLVVATLMELGLHEKVRAPRQAGFEKILNTHAVKPTRTGGAETDDAEDDEAIDA